MTHGRLMVALTIIVGVYASHSMLAAHVGEPVAPPLPRYVPRTALDASAPPDATADVAAESSARPRHHRPFWCELTNVSVRGWRGVSMALPDGRAMRRFAVPGVGLVVDAPAEAAPDYRVRIERTDWGYGGTAVHVGIAATIDGVRYCYEWHDPDVVPVDCR